MCVRCHLEEKNKKVQAKRHALQYLVQPVPIYIPVHARKSIWDLRSVE